MSGIINCTPTGCVPYEITSLSVALWCAQGCSFCGVLSVLALPTLTVLIHSLAECTVCRSYLWEALLQPCARHTNVPSGH